MTIQGKTDAALFTLGAAGYSAIELLWRGRTHWSMGLTGGVCVLAMHHVNGRMQGRPLWSRCIAGGGGYHRGGAGGGMRGQSGAGLAGMGLPGAAVQPVGTDLSRLQFFMDAAQRAGDGHEQHGVSVAAACRRPRIDFLCRINKRTSKVQAPGLRLACYAEKVAGEKVEKIARGTTMVFFLG